MRALRSVAGAALTAVSTSTLSAQTPAADTAVLVVGARAGRADSVLTGLAAQGFSGVVLVADGGRIVLRKGYGLANRARQTPFQPSTVVQIGSNTKDFTAVAILQLAERGKLSTRDSIGKFFFYAPPDKRGITIAQLMEHRSGFEPNLGGDFEVLSRDQFLTRAFASKLAYPPGTRERYSNLGYSMLAAIIEVVTGDSYGFYLQNNVWKPLDMPWTGLLFPHYDTLLLAHGYEGSVDQGTMLEKPHADNGPYWNLRGNGGFLSTVGEMYRFYDALYNTNRVLQPAERDQRFPPDRPVILAGSDMVCFFLYNREPQAGVVIIVATNASNFPAPRARDAIAELFGLPTPHGPRIARGGPGAKVVGPAAAVVFPETPAARRAQEYLSLFNRGDSAEAVPFIHDSLVAHAEDRRSPEERAGQMRAMRTRLGALTPLAITSSSATQIEFVVRPAEEAEATVTIDVEPAAPYRIVSVKLMVQ